MQFENSDVRISKSCIFVMIAHSKSCRFREKRTNPVEIGYYQKGHQRLLIINQSVNYVYVQLYPPTCVFFPCVCLLGSTLSLVSCFRALWGLTNENAMCVNLDQLNGHSINHSNMKNQPKRNFKKIK